MGNIMEVKKTYRVPCSWQMYGTLNIEAEGWDEAIEKAEDNDSPLPTDGSYVEASFEVDYDIVEFEREEEKESS